MHNLYDTPLIEMRYLVVINEYQRYDSRFDEEYTVEYESSPILQYKMGDRWITVPTVKILKKKLTPFDGLPENY